LQWTPRRFATQVNVDIPIYKELTCQNNIAKWINRTLNKNKMHTSETLT